MLAAFNITQAKVKIPGQHVINKTGYGFARNIRNIEEALFHFIEQQI